MKKVVIANWGTSRQGKSETVQNLAQLILKKYQNAKSEPAVLNFSEDIQIIITIGTTKIGIESQGDPNSRLFASLKEFVKVKCDIIICSTRTSGSTVQAVEELYRKYGYDNIWVTNHRSNEKDQQKLNALSAEQLFDLLQRLLSEKI